MTIRDTRGRFWAEALDRLGQAERLQRQFFKMTDAAGPGPTWEPPVDTLETPEGVLVLVALPGVPADQVEIVLRAGALTVRGMRPMPGGAHAQTILRLEIPYGHFERRLQLPPGHFELVDRSLADGTLRLLLRRLA